MNTFLYLSLLPEALIFSQLPPDRFGKYLAIGDKKQTRGPAMFFEVDPDLESAHFRLEEMREKCQPHSDGSPRRSTYVSVYAALAHTPINALRNLYLVTKDGLTLELSESSYEEPARSGLHLYQEICPVYPRVASPLPPREFSKFVTDPRQAVFLPRLVFSDLKLDDLAIDPEKSSAANLPYSDMNHLRACLSSLKYRDDKMTKIVLRDMNRDLLYYPVDTGFFVGDQNEFRFYPLPSRDALEEQHYSWWSSAISVSRF